MGASPTLNFGQPDKGLFSQEEIARLMESEYLRSLRYEYPLSVCMAEIDRLESLHDLYGVESERRILSATVSLLRSSTRASDVLGVQRDRRLLVLFPHTRRAGVVAIAQRLLLGCRELEFRGDGRVLRASLSIGCVERADEGSLAGLIERAEQALEAAVLGGGDRLLEYEKLPRRPAAALPRAPLSAEVAAPRPARARPSPGRAPLPDVNELPGASLEEKVRHLLTLVGGGDDAGRLESDVLAVLQRTLGEARGTRATREEVLVEIRTLEQRIAQLKRMLEASEEELARMVLEKSLDPGLASIYRSVQGLDPSESNYRKKKELLGVIYRANVELLRQLEGEVGRG